MSCRRTQARCGVSTVASSASTTARVAAVIQRGGSFLSGSFVNRPWAEDAAGRSTVCLTRSISYTVLISPIEMLGMFGMAQVIGAKTYGDQQLMDRWSIDEVPRWEEVPLAIRYQTQSPVLGTGQEQDSKRRRCQGNEVAYRLRLTIAWAYYFPILEHHRQVIEKAMRGGWLSVPQQTPHRDQPFLFAVVWAYAMDMQKSPTFLVVPLENGSIQLLRVDTEKPYDVSTARFLRPLQGMAFFDAWRIVPQMRFAPDAQGYGEPPLNPSPEKDQWNVEEERSAAGRMEQFALRQETPKDVHTFEITEAAVTSLGEVDDGLRCQLDGRDACYLKGNQILDQVGLAIADFHRPRSGLWPIRRTLETVLCRILLP